MRILYGAQPAVAIKKGGLYVQLLRTKEHMEKLGFKIDLNDPWKDPAKEDFSLFHLFGANFSTNILGTLMREKEIPLVLTPVFFSKHTPLMLRMVNRANGLLFELFRISTPHIYTKELLERADRILPNTPREKEFIIRGFGIKEEKVTLVHNGVDERFAHAQPDQFVERYALRDFILYVGYIGDGRKNTLALIRALQGIDVPSVFIGPPVRTPYGDLCVKEIRKNKRITLLDPLPHDSPMLASAYAACDTFVLPSLFETPGLAALEAGLAGAKIVITKFGGTEDYFRDEAIYVDPKNVVSIRDGINRALKKEKSGRLKEHIRNHYLWPAIAKQLEKVYLSFALPPVGDGA
jgi:glycosyltransferase involved in cell wall biosynthesis